MARAFAEVAFTPSVQAAQTRNGSAVSYAKFLAPEIDRSDQLTDREIAFITERDGFYQATVSESGWPYVQFRGGPTGFVKILDHRTIGYADFRGNRQYLSVGNIDFDARVSLILMDYPNQRRLKIWGRASLVDIADDPELIARLHDKSYRARLERAVMITVEAFDWNCPRHIPQRLTLDEFEPHLIPLREEIARLAADNDALKASLGTSDLDRAPAKFGGDDMTEKSETFDGSKYRYERFTTSLLFRDLRFRKGHFEPGDRLPAFKLTTTDGSELTNQNVLGTKPVLFVVGSITCPMNASAMPFLKNLHAQFGERIDFIMINVREAHPGEHFPQPTTMARKLEHTQALRDHYDIPWTVAADDINGSLHRALDPKPNSAVLVDRDGVIVFRSLWASDRSAIRQALTDVLAGGKPARPQSQALIGPVTRAMGRVQEVMERAGPKAVKELWIAGLPMAIAGRVATFFSPLSPDQRGYASVLTLALGMLLVLGLISAWLLR